MTTGAPIFLVSACTSGEEFVAAFRRYADRNGLFIPIADPLPAGRRGRFAVTLVDGGVMVEGDAEIVSSAKTASVLHGRVGMTLRFLDPDENSQTVLVELEKARLSMRPPPPSVPPRPAAIPAEPRAVPPKPAGRIDATNALAECVAIGDVAALEAVDKAHASAPRPGPRFIMPAILPVPGAQRPKSAATPPFGMTSPPGERARTPSPAPPMTRERVETPSAASPIVPGGAPMTRERVQTPSAASPIVPGGAPMTRERVQTPSAASPIVPMTRERVETPSAASPIVPSSAPMAAAPSPASPIATSRTSTLSSAAPPPPAAPPPAVARTSTLSSTAPPPPRAAPRDTSPQHAPVTEPTTEQAIDALRPLEADPDAELPTLTRPFIEPSADSSSSRRDDPTLRTPSGPVATVAEPTDATAMPSPGNGAPAPSRTPAEPIAAAVTRTPAEPIAAAVTRTPSAPIAAVAPPIHASTAPRPTPAGAVPAATPAHARRPASTPPPLPLVRQPTPARPLPAVAPRPTPSGSIAAMPPALAGVEVSNEATDLTTIPAALEALEARGTFDELVPVPQVDELEPVPQVDEPIVPKRTRIGIAVVPPGVTVLPATPAAMPDDDDAPDTSVMEAQDPSAGIVGPRHIDALAPTPLPSERTPQIEEPTPSGDWTMTPGADGPTIEPRKPQQTPGGLPAGDWTIELDSGSPDGWSPPRAAPVGRPHEVDARAPTGEPAAEPPPRPTPKPRAATPEPVAVASTKPLESDSRRDSQPVIPPAEPKVQVDPTLIEPLQALPVSTPDPESAGSSNRLSAAPSAPGTSMGGYPVIATGVHGDGAATGGYPAPAMPPSGGYPPAMPPTGGYPAPTMPPTGGYAPLPHASAMPPTGAFTPGAFPGPLAYAPPSSAAYAMEVTHGSPAAAPAPRRHATDGGTGLAREDLRYGTGPVPKLGDRTRRVKVIAISAAAAVVVGAVIVVALTTGGGSSPAASPPSEGSQRATSPSEGSQRATSPSEGSQRATSPSHTKSVEATPDAATAAPPAPADGAAIAVAPDAATIPGASEVARPKDSSPANPPATGQCIAEITSTPPGAEVVQDKTLVLGVTPATLALPCDVEVKLTLRKQRYVSVDKRVTPTDKGAKLKVTLPKPTLSVKVSSTPPGASITVAGKSVGVTPTTVKLTAFEASTLLITKDGYSIDQQKVTPKTNNQTVHATLRKLVKKPPR